MDPLPTHTIICLVCWSFWLFPFCASSGSRRLLPDKPLSAGNTITSGDGTFALGFFSPSSSGTKHYYVGIWYKNIPEDNVVWVANRAMPITDPSSATLAFTSGPDLALSDTNGQLLWTTSISTAGNSSSEATGGGEATLDNNGNFILRSSHGVILWQSFDHPTDTLLPGMNLRLTHKKLALQRLISWRSPQDPSPGSFSYGADPGEFRQRFIWNGSTPYMRGSVRNNNLVVGQYVESIKSTIYYTLQTIDDEVYASFGLPVPSVSSLVLMKIDYSGKIKTRAWNSNRSKWTDLWSGPNQDCNKFGYCGPFGYCDNTQPIVTCKCLNGFEPNNKQDWTARRFSQGCHRIEALKCGQGDGFLNMSNMKVPAQFLYVKNRSLDECIAECTSKCSCTAYAYNNVSIDAINGIETRCLLWTRNLIDTEKLIGQGENLYIRVNGSSDKKWKSKVLKITLPVVSSLLLIICVCLVWICNFGGKQRNKKIWKKLMSETSSTSVELHDGNLKCPFISFKEIVLATNNFSNMLGHGGFGNVYKGILGDGTEIAVKRLSKDSGQGVLEFRNEVILIAKLQHTNLVRLLGFCIHGVEKLLIYEYLPNKSLDAMLFDATRKSMLDWPIRFEIIKGIARGLLYLHQDSRLKIIHRDLKASNILLDAEMSPKISDFGMARIFGGHQQQENTNRVVGTYGYMSPEYALKGVFSVKSDIYSFGVLLLEIVSGSKISSVHLKADFSSIIAYAWSLWKDGNTKDFVDSSVVGSCSINETIRCIHIGLLCVQGSPNARPLVSSIVSFLENGNISLAPPKEPMYFAENNYGANGAAENTAISANTMSITVLEGR